MRPLPLLWESLRARATHIMHRTPNLMSTPVLASKGAVFVFTPFDGPGFVPIVTGEEGVQCSAKWLDTRGVGASSLQAFFGLFAHMTNHVRGYSSCPLTAILSYAVVLWLRACNGVPRPRPRPRVPMPPVTLVTPPPAMGKGSRKEDAIIGLVEAELGVLTVPGGVYYGTGPWAFMRVSLDRIIAGVPKDGRPPTPADIVIVEAKCKLKPDKQFMGEPPTLAYFMQCQVQCAVLGAGRALLATGYVPCEISLREVKAQNAEIAALRVPTVFRQDTQTIPMCADWARFAAQTGQPESFVHIVTILRHEGAIAAILDAMTRLHDLAAAIAAGTASDDSDSVAHEWAAIMATSNVIAICEAARVEAVLPYPQFAEELRMVPEGVVRRVVAPDGAVIDTPVFHNPSDTMDLDDIAKLVVARDGYTNACELEASAVRTVEEAATATSDCGDALYALAANNEMQQDHVAALRLALRVLVLDEDIAVGTKPTSVFGRPPSEPNHWTIAYHAQKVACGEKEVVDRDRILEQYPEVRAFSGGEMVLRGIRYFPSAGGDVVVLSFAPSKEVVELKRAVFAARPHLVAELAAAHQARVDAGDGDDLSLSAPDHPDTWHLTLGTVKRGAGSLAVAFLCALSGLPVEGGFRVDAVAAAPPIPRDVMKRVNDAIVAAMGGDMGLKEGDVFGVHSLAVCTAVSDTIIGLGKLQVDRGDSGFAYVVEDSEPSTKRVKVPDDA